MTDGTEDREWEEGEFLCPVCGTVEWFDLSRGSSSQQCKTVKLQKIVGPRYKEGDNLVYWSVAIDKLRRMGEHADIACNTTGFKLLQPVSEYLGFSLDQVGASAPEIYLRVQLMLLYG